MGFGWDDSGEFRGGFGINSGDSKDENDFLGEIYHVGGFPGTKNQVPDRFYKENPGNPENSRFTNKKPANGPGPRPKWVRTGANWARTQAKL